jgi:hypothetical protein
LGDGCGGAKAQGLLFLKFDTSSGLPFLEVEDFVQFDQEQLDLCTIANSQDLKVILIMPRHLNI